MDQGKVAMAVALCAGLSGGGCGRTGDPGSSTADVNATPTVVVSEFLEAVRLGDDEKAAGLLTPLARQKTSEMEMVVAPPGSDTARYQVLELEIDGDAAHVSSDWTDLDTDGQAQTDRIVWVLRKVTQGWRISGMITRVFADQQPIELNFEDPAEMLRKQQQAEEEIARRDQRTGSSMHKQPPEGTPAVR